MPSALTCLWPTATHQIWMFVFKWDMRVIESIKKLLSASRMNYSFELVILNKLVWFSLNHSDCSLMHWIIRSFFNNGTQRKKKLMWIGLFNNYKIKTNRNNETYIHKNIYKIDYIRINDYFWLAVNQDAFCSQTM